MWCAFQPKKHHVQFVAKKRHEATIQLSNTIKILLIMKKIFYLTLLLSVILLPKAQSQQGWGIGLDYFPNISVESSDQRLGEGSKFSNSIGIFASRELSRRLVITGGFNFANTGHKTGPDVLRWGLQHDGQGGFDPNTDPQENITFIHNYYHLEAPVKLLYAFVDKKFRCYISAAAVPRLHLANQAKWEVASSVSGTRETTVDDPINYRALTVGFQSGIGVARQILGRHSIFLEPRVQFNPVRGEVQGRAVKGEYISYGLALGVKLDLMNE